MFPFAQLVVFLNFLGRNNTLFLTKMGIRTNVRATLVSAEHSMIELIKANNIMIDSLLLIGIMVKNVGVVIMVSIATL